MNKQETIKHTQRQYKININNKQNISVIAQFIFFIVYICLRLLCLRLLCFCLQYLNFCLH